jgi:4-aminobutyrate aminotransferase-like enzyme
LKACLARELSRITFERWAVENPKSKIQNPKSAKTLFCNSGFEAVEAALKTALLATGKSGVIAFEGAYHGLGYGSLNATHRKFFRGPFRSQLGEFGHFVPYPAAAGEAGLLRKGRRAGDETPADAVSINSKPETPDAKPLSEPSDVGCDGVEKRIRSLLRQERIGAILVEPVQGRGGINIPPPDFLPRLRRLCDQHGALLILDEIYTGFGRTGKWFACEHSGVVPDLICLGKALTGGFPLSACVGRTEVMDRAWPPSSGEAIHTSTFLGHPVGCAMALAQIAEIRRRRLPERSARLGVALMGRLRDARYRMRDTGYRIALRGTGLMVGLELRRQNGSPAGAETLRVIKAMLRRGYILLPEGEHANVIGFTPPLTITREQLANTVTTLAEVLT